MKIHFLGSLAFWVLTDVTILTVDTPHIAITKENSSSSPGA